MINPFVTTAERPVAPKEPITAPQTRFLRDLCMKRAQIKGMALADAEAALETWIPQLDKRMASKMIDRVKQENELLRKLFGPLAANGKTRPIADVLAEVKDGFYELKDGRIVKVVHAVHGSGFQYGKVLDTDSGVFFKVTGILHAVREHGVELTLERARELGTLYGMCMRCGATLTDETSIANGIGPICATKF